MEGEGEVEMGRGGMGKGGIGPPTFWLLPPPMTGNVLKRLKQLILYNILASKDLYEILVGSPATGLPRIDKIVSFLAVDCVLE